MRLKFPPTIHTMGFIVRVSLIAVAVIPLLVYLFLNNMVVSGNFFALEQNSVRVKTDVAAQMLEDRAVDLKKLARDYAIWDEAYNNIQMQDRAWFRENYSRWLPANRALDLIVVADENKEVVDQFGAGDTYPAELLNNEKIAGLLNQQAAGAPDKYPCGLKVVRGELYIISASPILKNYFQGAPKGIVVFGQRVTPKLLAGIFKTPGIFVSYGDRLVPAQPADSPLRQYLSNSPKNGGSDQADRSVVLLDKSTIIGTAPLRDISGHRLGSLMMTEPRSLFSSTQETIRRNGYMALALSVLIIIVLSVQFRRFIISPLRGLEEQITQMGNNNVLGYVDARGPSEIVSLAGAFNRLTAGLLAFKKENESLKTISITDELTTLYNHRYLFDYFKSKTSMGTRQFAILFCDIDHFKIINDIHGHLVGDMVLRNISALMKDVVGKKGAIFRYGGEEFVILLENFNAEQAYYLAEKIRVKVAASRNMEHRLGYYPITISIGVAAYPDDALAIENLISHADKAMYYAKQSGRNQVQIYSPDIEISPDKKVDDFSRQEMLIDSVYTLAALIDAKDRYTEKHSESVVKFALLMAEKMQLSERDRYILRIGGLLHDVGKIGIPDEIINTADILNKQQWRVVKNHTILGGNIVRHIIKISEIEACIRYHHERWDGTGYPEGLVGPETPYHARIIGIADAYHAMISDRPYRQALTPEEAISDLMHYRGTQFDPELVDVLIDVIRENWLTPGADMVASAGQAN